MSYKTWAKKYYPIKACKVAKADALQHSLQKWKGLALTVLKEHGIEQQKWHWIASLGVPLEKGSGECLGIDGGSTVAHAHFVFILKMMMIVVVSVHYFSCAVEQAAISVHQMNLLLLTMHGVFPAIRNP